MDTSFASTKKWSPTSFQDSAWLTALSRFRHLHHFVYHEVRFHRHEGNESNSFKKKFSGFYLVPIFFSKLYEPVVNIQGAELSKCCVSNKEEDLCGRRDCIQCRNAAQEELPIKTSDNNAFFHETSAARELDTRQTCAVESLALLNRNMKIYLLTTSHDVNLSASTMKSLSSYSNIRIININLGQYFLGTLLEHWYFCTTWNYGSYAVSHLSDALRFLTIYKYGGYYFDLDVIQLRSSESHRNFVVADLGLEFMAAGAFHIEYKHPVMQLALDEFKNTYRSVNYIF